MFILILVYYYSVFCVTKSNKNIKGLNIFQNEFLYTAYADGTNFFLKDKSSVFETSNIFHKFSLVSGLSPDTTKCEIASVGTLKGVNVALCGMKCLNLTKETVKIFGVDFCCNKELEHEMNFQSHIVKTESVLRLWSMRNLTIEGKILIFKPLVISKIGHLTLITAVPHAVINHTQ